MYKIADDLNGTGNGDVTIVTDKGTLVALIYANDKSIAHIIVNALNAALSPSMTDLMLSPEDIDTWLENNGPHDLI